MPPPAAGIPVTLPEFPMHVPTAAPLAAKPLPFYRQLYFQVVVAIVLGAILGHYEPAFAESLEPLGDAIERIAYLYGKPTAVRRL